MTTMLTQILTQIIVIFWLLFIIYWFVSALQAKKSVKGYSRLRSFWIPRLLIMVIIIFILQFQSVRHFFDSSSAVVFGPTLNVLGVLLCAAGLGLAIWARVHLGRNWGMPMTVRQEPELVTSGPYRFIRHPIYSGILLAALGSAFSSSTVWFLVVLGSAVYFVFSAHIEEQLMLSQFPEQYPAYLKRTKRLIPFLY